MTIKNVICDIDGVLMHDNVAVPGAAEFLHGIMDKGLPLVLLTNYPSQTGQDLANRFATAGVDVPDSVFYTSAMATADFLRRQEGKKAYVVGEGALIHELYKAGFMISYVMRNARKRMWMAKSNLFMNFTKPVTLLPM